MDGENIGNINVSIGADYSPLKDAIQASEQVAAQGGKDIANALAAGAASAVNIGTEISESLGQIGTAASAAAASLDPFESKVAELVSQGSTLAEAISQATASLDTMAPAAAEAAGQLNLFGTDLESIPWAEATGQLNLFTDELEPLMAGSVAAAEGVNTLGSAEAEAGQQAQQGAGGLQEFAQQLVAIGTAAVITSKLEAFGAAALEASDDVKRADISLTALTGSAATAADEIGKLENLAVEDALSMPGLLTAATRMQALLGASAQVVPILSQLANSAAVSGVSIESAANAFDRIATSGSVAARQLVPLGINLDDLSKAFNELSGTSIATSSNIKELFKSLSETERIAVLSDALSKLNGIGHKVAEETFGGQWNSMVAEWTRVMKEAGDVLAPIIGDLTEFVKVDVAPFLEGAIKLFGELPAPIKDTTVGVGLFTVALVPLAATVGTVAIAVTGLKSALAGLAAQAGTTAVAEGAAAVASGELGAAAGVAATEVGAAGAAAGVAGAGMSALLVPILAIAAELGILVKAWVDMGHAQDGAKTANDDLQRSTAVLGASLKQHGVDISDLTAKYQQGIISPQQYREALLNLVNTFTATNKALYDHKAALDLAADAVNKITDESNKQTIAYGIAKEAFDKVKQGLAEGTKTQQDYALALAALNTAAAALATPLNAVSLALANNQQAAMKASQEYGAAKGVFDSVLASYNAGVATYGQLTAAQEKLTAAETAAAQAGVPVAGTIAAIDAAAKSAISSMTALATSQQLSADAAVAQSDSLKTLSQDVVIAGQKLDLLVSAQKDAQTAADNHKISQDQLRTVMLAVSAAAKDLQDKQDALALAQIRAGNAASVQQGMEGLLSQSLKEANLQLDEAKRKYDAGAISGDQYANSAKAVVTSLIALHQEQADSAANTGRSTAAWAAADVELAQAKSKLDDLTAAYQKHLTSIQSVMSAKKGELDAQIAVDQQQAIAATGTQGLTDKVSLYTQILAAAKAKQQDLSQAVSEGRAKAEELLAADNAVINATQNLADAQKACKPPVDALTQAADTQTKSLKSLADQAKEDSKAYGSLAQDLKDLTHDFLGLGEAQSKAFSVGAKAGYTLQIGGGAGGYVINEVPTPETALSLELAAAKASADQSSNPKHSSDPGTLAAQDLAEAAATLKVYTQEFKAGNALVTAKDVASAQQAVASAQAVIDKLNGVASGTGSSASSGAESAANIQVLQASLNTANQLLTQAQFNYQNGSGTLDEFKSAQALEQVAQTAYDAAIKGKSSSTAAQVTSGSVDNASSGGSYPGVVIHQAAGEVLLVAVASGAQAASAGNGAAAVPVTGLADATAAQAASSTAQVVSTAANTMNDTVTLLGELTGKVQTIYEAAANLHMKDTLVVGTTQTITPTGSSSGGTATSTTGTSGYGNSLSGGGFTNVQNGGLPSGGPIGYVQTVNPQTTSGSSGPSSVTANVDLSGSNFGAMSPSEVQGIVTQSLTRALRDSGGRF